MLQSKTARLQRFHQHQNKHIILGKHFSNYMRTSYRWKENSMREAPTPAWTGQIYAVLPLQVNRTLANEWVAPCFKPMKPKS